MRKIANVTDFKIELHTRILFELDYEVVQLVRHSVTNNKAPDSIPDVVIWNFHSLNPSISNAILVCCRLSL
jgi:hypothetical protein